jgi:hypothetical protein
MYTHTRPSHVEVAANCLDISILFITIMLYHALSHMLNTTTALHISLPDEKKARDRLREQ